MRRSCPTPCVCANYKNATVLSLQRRRRKKRDAIKRREKRSDVGSGRDVAARQRRFLTMMGVAMAGASLLCLDVLQVLAIATLALLSTPAAILIGTTVDVPPILHTGMDVVAVAQTLVTDSENVILLTRVAAVLLTAKGDLGGLARTSLTLTCTVSDAPEVAVTLLTGEYGMVIMEVRANAIVVVRPRSRPPLTSNAPVLVHHPSHQSPRAPTEAVQHAWLR
jgi:hypothetical protein